MKFWQNSLCRERLVEILEVSLQLYPSERVQINNKDKDKTTNCMPSTIGFTSKKKDKDNTNTIESVAKYLALGLMALRSFQSSIIFPNILCVINHLCIRSDDLEKKNAESNKKGTVGKRGKATPKKAKIRVLKPKTLHTMFK